MSWSPQKAEEWYRGHPVIPARDYRQTILPRIEALGARVGFKVEKYGEATYKTDNHQTNSVDKVTHDLFQVIIGDFDPEKPTFVIIGGTHGYEKGGPLTALKFAEEEAEKYAGKYNFIIYPCACPGPYEKELRYTEGRIDPNRNAFPEDAKSVEMRALAASLKNLHERMFGNDLSRKFAAAVDLHETPKKDIEIDQESAALGLETFDMDMNKFPEGLFLITFEKDAEYTKRIIAFFKNAGHSIVNDEEIYNRPNRGGYIVTPTEGKVRGLTSLYAEANFTTELCGKEICDEKTPDEDRIAPQMTVITAMLNQYQF
ncbi:MAG: hypothetical protein ACT4OY_09120 [Alphaproteobacteria bacterium]